jgi:hypothetical protein
MIHYEMKLHFREDKKISFLIIMDIFLILPIVPNKMPKQLTIKYGTKICPWS